MTSTTTIPVGSNGEYLGDRYERLCSGAEQIASDPNVAASDSIFTTNARLARPSCRSFGSGVGKAVHAVGCSTCEEGAPLCGRPFLVEVVGQRPLPKVGVTEPTVACCWMSCTQSW
jgi:hypothetical protein